MSTKQFENLCTILCDKLSDKNLKIEKSESILNIIANCLSFKVSYISQNNEVTLELSTDSREEDPKTKSLCSWLLTPDSTAKEISEIAEDFRHEILRYMQEGKSFSAKKIPSGKTSDTLFFANRMANFFPELKEKITYEKTHYSEFRPVSFTSQYVVPKILQLLSEDKDSKKILKLFNTLEDLYDNSSLDVRCIITMGILSPILCTQAGELLNKYLSNNMKKVLQASSKYKNTAAIPPLRNFSCG